MSDPAGLLAFGSALRREAHVLAARPDLTWPQLHVHLQADPAVAAAISRERAARLAPSPGGPWLWARPGKAARANRSLTGEELGWLRACAVSPDGTWVVAASEAGTDPGSRSHRAAAPVLMVWDVATGAPRAVLRGHERNVWDCDVGPDSTWVASASQDGTIRLWDATTGYERRRLDAHLPGVALACRVTPDGARIVSAGQGGAKLWDVTTGRELGAVDLRRPSDVLSALAVSPEGQRAVLGLGRSLYVWDLSTGRLRPVGTPETSPHELGISSCVVGPDGCWAASVAGRQIGVWDLASGTVRQVLRGEDWFEACAISPDGTTLVSAGRDGTVRIWNPATGEQIAVLYGHEGWVQDCTITPDGESIVSAGRDGTVRFWDVAPQRVVDASDRAPNRSTEPHAFAGWRPNVDASPELWSPSISPGEVRAVAPDGSWVVTGAAGCLRVWDVGKQRSCGVLRAGVEPVTGAVLSHFGADITACVIAPDGRWLVSVAGDSCQFWDMTAGGRPLAMPGAVGGAVCAVSPDGRWIVAGRRDGGLVVTEIVADHQSPIRAVATRELSGHRDAVTGSAVTPDARSIVSAGADRALRVWDVEAGTEVAALFLPTRIEAVVLHPWRPWIACRTADGDVPLAIAGMEYGPIVVTARGPESTVVCPACATEQTVGASGLGGPLTCRGPGCSLTLFVNPFVVREGPPSGLYDDTDEEVGRQWYGTR